MKSTYHDNILRELICLKMSWCILIKISIFFISIWNSVRSLVLYLYRCQQSISLPVQNLGDVFALNEFFNITNCHCDSLLEPIYGMVHSWMVCVKVFVLSSRTLLSLLPLQKRTHVPCSCDSRMAPKPHIPLHSHFIKNHIKLFRPRSIHLCIETMPIRQKLGATPGFECVHKSTW